MSSLSFSAVFEKEETDFGHLSDRLDQPKAEETDSLALTPVRLCTALVVTLVQHFIRTLTGMVQDILLNLSTEPFGQLLDYFILS